MWSGSGVTWSEAELLQNERDLTTKWEQPWPQLMRCASIYYHVCSCIFQEDGIVARSFGEEWYKLIGVRIGVMRAPRKKEFPMHLISNIKSYNGVKI